MGVTGLWTVVHPCARPIKLETLNKKRLAVDASIWIYQFLKAVRDKEGNALRNSHVVGFFRRICKLLFFGIKPVFVFDGGAPALKRQTIAGRKRRREGRREDAVRTAGKLLAVQMQRRAEEEAERRKEEMGKRRRDVDEEEEVVPEEVVYVEELGMTRDERKRNRGFRKKDAYHLPEMADSLENLGKPDDPRIMSHEELEEYARQFHSGEDINLYDFSKIDFNSPFFLSLPASDRYNILNAARLRSRLRMGYSKDQLEGMFPDRMAFSKFQIERVTERNELTQRLMNINGMNGEDAMNGVGRVAGEKGKEYVLVKNDGVDGGWALGVVTSKEQGERNKPIDLDDLIKEEGVKSEDEDEDSPAEDGGFEDVPIEGLNRLPKLGSRTDGLLPNLSSDEQRRIAKRRQAVYRSRQQKSLPKARKAVEDQDPDSLFIAEERDDEPDAQDEEEEIDDLFEDVEGFQPRENDEDLDRAIAMSLEQHEQENNDDVRSITIQDIQQSRADESRPFAKGSGKMIAHIANNRSNAAALKAAQQKADGNGVSNLQHTTVPSSMPKSPLPEAPAKVTSGTNGETALSEPMENPFGGPLPFEKLDFSKSLLGAKKRKADAENAGGFEKAPDGEPAEKPKPLPPWFASDAAQDSKTQEKLEKSLRESDKLKEKERVEEARAKEKEDAEMKRILHRHETGDVVEVESSDDGRDSDVQMVDVVPVDSEIRMGDVADLIRAEPPETHDARAGMTPVAEQNRSGRAVSEEPVEWEESDAEEINGVTKSRSEPTQPAGGGVVTEQQTSPGPAFEVISSVDDPVLLRASISPSPEYEDVEIAAKAPSIDSASKGSKSPPKSIIPELPVDDSFDQAPLVDDEVEDYSDPEDEDLMQQLALEAEEHARFAAELNHKSQHQNQEDYERDLRALRNQQKKDRRDADEVSHIMVTECQQLLKLFGLPYITAPMEAEAQCAELVRLGLVDGIVTDDSDCFLFGGTRIYKNMFNQAKFVECYLAGDLEKEFDLDRDKLIRIAHLLGSDYTEGIPNVGPVTALEIVSEFNSEQGLEEFRDWLASIQQGSRLASEDATSPFRKKFRRNATRIFLPPAFPSQAVTQAYLEPEVDSSTDPFQWGIPDLDHLRSYLMATIGWTQERTDEVLVPVIKDMNRRANEGTQSNITGFFSGTTGAGAFAPRKKGEVPRKGGAKGSSRLEGALGKLRDGAKRKRKGSGEGSTGDADVTAVKTAAEQRSKPKKAARRNGRGRTKVVEQSSSDDEVGNGSS